MRVEVEADTQTNEENGEIDENSNEEGEQTDEMAAPSEETHVIEETPPIEELAAASSLSADENQVDEVIANEEMVIGEEENERTMTRNKNRMDRHYYRECNLPKAAGVERKRSYSDVTKGTDGSDSEGNEREMPPKAVAMDSSQNLSQMVSQVQSPKAKPSKIPVVKEKDNQGKGRKNKN